MMCVLHDKVRFFAAALQISRNSVTVSTAITQENRWDCSRNLRQYRIWLFFRNVGGICMVGIHTKNNQNQIYPSVAAPSFKLGYAGVLGYIQKT